MSGSATRCQVMSCATAVESVGGDTVSQQVESSLRQRRQRPGSVPRDPENVVDDVGGGVSFRGDDGQVSPDVLEEAAAVGEARFESVEVQRERQVAFEQQALPVGVGNPVAEEDRCVEEAGLLGNGACRLDAVWRARSALGWDGACRER